MEEAILNSIKTLTRVYYDYQRERMALDGRIGQTKSGAVKKGVPVRDMTMLLVIKERRESVMEFEEGILHGYKRADGTWDRDEALCTIVHQHPLWKAYLQEVKGIGEGIAAVILSEYDIYKADTVSKLYQFGGMNPGLVRGKVWKKDKAGNRIAVVTDTMVRGDKRTAGFICPYNQFLKSKLLGVLGPSFLKCASPYSEFYYNMRQRLESEDWGTASKNPTDKKKPKAAHQHNAANCYMVKRFLQDLYVAWRTLEGLPVREPYQEQYLGHRHTA